MRAGHGMGRPIHVPIRVVCWCSGALSGMGLCYMELARYAAAVRCLERALQLHPNLPEIRRVLEMLRAKVADSTTEEGEGIGGGEAV